MTDWIDIKEREPLKGRQYLCCDEKGFREVGYLTMKNEWKFAESSMGKVVAWLPLPEPWKGVNL